MWNIVYNRITIAIIFAILFLSVPVPVFALDPSKSIPQYVHDVWQIEDGLPQNSVNDIEQDAQGYLWLATLEGLVRFDGVTFTVFNKTNIDAIKSNEMRSFYLDNKNVLWIGSYGGGLIRFENGIFTSFGKEDGLDETRVWEISGSDIAGIWLATHEGLYRYQNGAFTCFTAEDGLAGNDVRCVHVDKDGKVWAGTMNGLSLFEHGSFKTFTTEQGLSHNKIKSIARDSRGRLWIGTHSGLNMLENGSFSIYTTKHGLIHESVIGIFEDSSGAMWFGTEGGISRLFDGVFSSFTTEQGLSQNIIRSFFEDREGSLWVGTETGGLNRLREGKFTPYTKHTGLPVDLIWSFFEDSDGRLMIGSGEGLVVFKEDTFSLFRREADFSSNTISALYEAQNGTFWVGTSGDGLFIFKDGAFESFPGQDEVSNDYILSLNEDIYGNLWIGTRDGLRQLKDGKVTFFSTKDGLAGNVVRYIEATIDGGLWIGTGTGLSYYKEGKFKKYTTEDGLSSNAVFSIHTDADESLWLGTYGGGLNRYKSGSFHHITTKQGLFDDVVYVILEDSNNNLWMSGNKGIFCVSKQEFDDFIEGKIDSIFSPSYGVCDGMKSRECNGGLQPAGYHTEDGKMWFPTIKGAVSIQPDHLKINTVVPPVYIVHLLVDGEEIKPGGQLKLKPGVQKLEFHYTALSYAVPKKVMFKYKLEGYDTEWADAGTRRVAYYTNLAPGSYTFRVKACNDDGLWNEAGASFSFQKMPYFYETSWFMFSIAALILLLMFTIYRLRIRHMKRRERELESLVALRTKELREISLQDSLTGLRNRRFVTEIVKPETMIFAERKKYMLEHKGPRSVHPIDSYMGIFILDIDHFKVVNDTLGHDAGDRILKQFSNLLSLAIRKDDIVVRWGGEEFLIILKHTSYSFIEKFARNIKDVIEHTEFIVSEDPRKTVNKTCSIGYVSFPFHKEAPDLISFEQAIMLADLGLFYSKKNGRNLAVGVLPTEKLPTQSNLVQILSSINYGIEKGFLRIEAHSIRVRQQVTRVMDN